MNEDGIDRDVLSEQARRFNRKIYQDAGELFQKRRAKRAEEAEQARAAKEKLSAQIDEFVAQKRQRQAQWERDVEQNTGPVTTNPSSPEKPETE